MVDSAIFFLYYGPKQSIYKVNSLTIFLQIFSLKRAYILGIFLKKGARFIL